MQKKKRIVITGVGAVTALGCDFRNYLMKIEQGLKLSSVPLYLRDIEENIQVYAVPEEVDLRTFIKKRKSVKIMSRTIQLAVAASRIAFDDSGLSDGDFNSQRAGISLATGVMNYELEEMFSAISLSHVDGKFSLHEFGEQGLDALFPLWSLKYIPNMPACHISIENNLQGPSNTHTSSNASGIQALGEAVQVIQRGDADLMLVGATDTKLHPLGLVHLKKQNLLRDEKNLGIQASEGSGSMIIESLEHAKNRGAKIYGEVLGFSSNHDFDCHEENDMKLKCMRKALKNANIDAGALDFVIGNQCGFEKVDGNEETALKKLFEKDTSIPVVRMKDWFGYVEHASGLIETCFALFCLNEMDGVKILKKRYGQAFEKAQTFMLNAFGLYGHNSSLVVKKMNEGDVHEA